MNNPENNISFADMKPVEKTVSNTEYIEITKSFLVSGMQSGVGCNNDQLRLLGVELPAKKGWKKDLIGKKISTEDAAKFIALKGLCKRTERKKIISGDGSISKNNKKECIFLSKWESIILYQLLKNEYCDTLDVLPRTAEISSLLKNYSNLMDKLEKVIAKTT